MKTEKPEFDAEELTLITLAKEYSDEDKARALLESLLWPNGPVCPRCHFNEVYKITPRPGSKSPTRKGVYKCAACREHFTVTVGTILEDSHLPISKWLMAFFILFRSDLGAKARRARAFTSARPVGNISRSRWAPSWKIHICRSANGLWRSSSY